MPLGNTVPLDVEGHDPKVEEESKHREMMARGDACHIVRDFVAHFSNPLRLKIMCELYGSESSVTDLVEATGARQPTVSQQLNLLRLSGIVTRTRVGNRSMYRFADPLAQEMMEYIFTIAAKLLKRQGESTRQPPE